MIRGTTRTLLLSSVVVLASAGCDALTVRSFSGSILQMTLEPPSTGGGSTAAGQHIELWVRTQSNDIVQLKPFYDETNYLNTNGFVIRQAISMDSPCMTDDKGNLLTDDAAYPTSVTFGGVIQTPHQQAVQRQQRIAQLTPTGAPLLAVVPWQPPVLDGMGNDITLEPTFATTPTPAERKARCDAYRAAGPNTYIPNPDQISTPLHGTVFGFLGFTTQVPPTNYDGIRFDTPTHLEGMQELFMTIEGNTVNPTMRGPLYVVSKPMAGGRQVLSFQLVPAQPGGPQGGLSVYTNLDQDPVQF